MSYRRSPAQRAEEIAMMSQPAPGKWPLYPVLPVKKKADPESFDLPIMGVLFADEPPIIYDLNPFAAVEAFGRVLVTGQWPPVIAKYESFEAVVADGWVVD